MHVGVCACVWMRACVRACVYMYVGYDVGVSCVATVVVTDCLWPQQHLINLSSTRQQLSDSILNFSTIFPLCHWGPPLDTNFGHLMRRYIYFRHNMHDLVDKPSSIKINDSTSVDPNSVDAEDVLSWQRRV